MFFALKGENFNGNEFAEQALKNGARYAVVDDKNYAKNQEDYILVKNVLETLQKLALFHRNYLEIPILAITGSNGKTTTKELVHAVLARKFKTIATKGNLNNHIGVPLTLLSMDDQTEFGIVEMGANHLMEIEFLCTIANPDYGYITNFGKAHLEGFGGVEGVIKGKTELYKFLQEKNKLIFLNHDDDIQRKHENYSHTFSFGENKGADVRLTYDLEAENAQINYNNTDFKSQLTGSYNAKNMAAALCIGLYFKVDFKEIHNAIENYNPTNNRSQVVESGSNKIIMDAYNANPTSMHAALENFRKLKTNKQKIAILGDMFELGSAAPTEHQVIANFAKNSEFAETYLVGENFKNTDCNSNFIFKFRDTDHLVEHLKESEFSNCYFLIKGSRGMALERALDAIKK
ncbi:UDP-N-acetylmuramoyl-tripeptide--D-alanyl-D-alanine ligase [Pontixanthobacter gangjinensis]